MRLFPRVPLCEVPILESVITVKGECQSLWSGLGWSFCCCWTVDPGECLAEVCLLFHLIVGVV